MPDGDAVDGHASLRTIRFGARAKLLCDAGATPSVSVVAVLDRGRRKCADKAGYAPIFRTSKGVGGGTGLLLNLRKR
jgi:hypothetical protein